MLMNAHKRQTGFGLVEVLVSLLIMSIGLLGIASLQVMALKNVGSSMERSQAVIQTYSYLDVLRANRAQAVISSLDVPVMTCDPLNLAASKVEQRKWITQLQETLGPQACGQVECLGGGKCTITVQWDDSRAEGGLAEQQLVTETML
jgi:type IV pilus assembly protein PilV